MTDDQFPITIEDATVTFDVISTGELEIHVESENREYVAYHQYVDNIYDQAVEQGDIDVP